jgi:hypothetical protein
LPLQAQSTVIAALSNCEGSMRIITGSSMKASSARYSLLATTRASAMATCSSPRSGRPSPSAGILMSGSAGSRTSSVCVLAPGQARGQHALGGLDFGNGSAAALGFAGLGLRVLHSGHWLLLG